MAKRRGKGEETIISRSDGTFMAQISLKDPKLVKLKRLPATKIGRGIRIPTKAVMDFINSGGAVILSGKVV